MNVIYSPKGDILKAKTYVIVNPVNCVGVMGKGLALKFKNKYPAYFSSYVRDCKYGLVVPGQITYWATGEQPEFIASFPTKRHWRDKSRMEDIEAGLRSMRSHALHLFSTPFSKRIPKEFDLTIAFPKLGCGLGGLRWTEVRPKILAAFEDLEHVSLELYGEPPA